MIVNPVQKQQIETLVETVINAFSEFEVLKDQLEEDDIEADEYRSGLLSLVIKDMFVMFFGFIILSLIGAGLTAIGLGIVVAIIAGLLALGLLITYFKQIVVSIILCGTAIYFIDISSLTEDDKALAIMVATFIAFLVFRLQIVLKRKKMVDKMDRMQEISELNYNKTIQFLSPVVKQYIDENMMGDVRSLQDNGLGFVPNEFIENALQDEAEKGNLELIKLPQKEINLYKSKSPISSPQASMITTVLEID